MKRLIRSRMGLLVGVVAFVLSITLTLLLKPPQIASITTVPLVSETAHEDPVILTMVNQDGGMAYTDEYLRLRVYLSGRIEGDSFDTESNKHTRQSAMLDDVRLANLKRALEQRDLLKCKDKYPPFVIYTDTYTHATLTFRVGNEEKSIALTNPESAHPGNIENYPKALITLLSRVDEITEHFKFR
jgi:hypothetical protein